MSRLPGWTDGPGLLVTGTDTEVGKTHVSACLAAALAAHSTRPVWALKPLATGEAWPGTDARLIARAAGHAPAVFACFDEPASPERAASLQGLGIDPAAVLQWIRGHTGFRLVEGVGGFEVPLTAEWRVSDLAEDLGWPVLLVAANRLGVLNHTLLSAQAIQARGLRLAGVVLVDAFGCKPSLAHGNHEDLCRHLSAPVIRMPHIETQQATMCSVGQTLLAGLA